MRLSRKSAMLFAAVLAAAQLSACGRYAEIETAGQTTAASGAETTAEQSAAGESDSQSAAGETEETAAQDGAERVTAGIPVESGSTEQPASQGEDAQAFFEQSGMSKEEAAAFVKTFLEAVKADNREAVAGMITYPRKVKTPAGEGTAGSAEEFLAYYDEIFTAQFREKLGAVSASDLFCKDGLIGLGDGSVWFYPATVEDDMGVSTVNVSEDRYVRYDGPSGVQPG